MRTGWRRERNSRVRAAKSRRIRHAKFHSQPPTDTEPAASDGRGVRDTARADSPPDSCKPFHWVSARARSQTGQIDQSAVQEIFIKPGVSPSAVAPGEVGPMIQHWRSDRRAYRQPSNSRCNQARARRHSRCTVAGEMPMAAPIWSAVKPTKKRSETIFACRGSICSSASMHSLRAA